MDIANIKLGPCAKCGDFKKPCKCYYEDLAKGQGLFIKELNKQIADLERQLQGANEGQAKCAREYTKLKAKLAEAERVIEYTTATLEKMRLDVLKHHNMGRGVESCKECDRNWLISRYVNHIETAQDFLKDKEDAN